MTILQALYMGILEGLTEFLPVSSTGHLILLSHFLRIRESDFLVVFEIAIQLGAILAVIYMYWDKLFHRETIERLIVGFVPTGIVGFLVYPHIKTLLTHPIIVGITLLLGGIIIFFVERAYFVWKEEGKVVLRHQVSIKEAFILGLCQTIAIVPGVSRSGATIIGGLLMKLDRTILTEFTFLLAVPTMLAATLYSVYKNIHLVTQVGNISSLLVGTITAFVVATFVIKLFLDYIRKHSFIVFGVYRIIIGIIVILTFVM